jgi:hypothetical protein
VIDDPVGSGPAQQRADGEAMDHSRGDVNLADRVAVMNRLASSVEIEEAASRIEVPMLKEIEQAVSLIRQPPPMERAHAPARAEGRESWQGGRHSCSPGLIETSGILDRGRAERIALHRVRMWIPPP